jgi:hypothetical protein
VAWQLKPSNFYRCSIESITARHGNCTASSRRALQRMVRSAHPITGGKLPALQDTYSTRCHRKVKNIIKDNNHPSQCLFKSLSSARRGQYRCIKSGTETLKNSFNLKVIRLLNPFTSTLQAAALYTETLNHWPL